MPLLPSRAVLILLLILLPACATSKARRQAESDLHKTLEAARSLLGARRVAVGGASFRDDCSGFVRGSYSAAGLDLGGQDRGRGSDTENLYRELKARGRLHDKSKPQPGDLAFFHNTWDRNGNKLRDDRFTHVALVEAVDDDGTVTLIHWASKQVKRDFINPRHPGTAKDPSSGKRWNSPLRRGKGKVLTGQLLVAFGRPLPR